LLINSIFFLLFNDVNKFYFHNDFLLVWRKNYCCVKLNQYGLGRPYCLHTWFQRIFWGFFLSQVMLPKRVINKRDIWTQEAQEKAIGAISTKKISDYKATKAFGIPRRTIWRYVKSGCVVQAKLGRRLTFTSEQQEQICSRIIKLSQISYPVTSKVLRLCVYKFCCKNNKHQFSEMKGMTIASHIWARKFFKQNPTISIRKAQNLNLSRAEKLNRFIVQTIFKNWKPFSRSKTYLENLNSCVTGRKRMSPELTLRRCPT
jgi:hypothetical protein